MKLISAYFLLFISSIFAQPQQDKNFIFTETTFLPIDSAFILSISFKIPYNKLVFEKNDDLYSSEFSFWLEVMDSSGSFVNRQIKDYQVNAKSFNETNKSSSYFEGLIEFDIKPGSYQIIPVFSDKNANREIKLPSKNIVLKSVVEKKYLEPLVIKSNEIICDGSSLKVLANFEGHIPFSEESYDLLIPAKEEAEKIFLTILNNKDTVYRDYLSDKYFSGLDIAECNGNIVIKNDGEKYHNFILKGINKDLVEGSLIIYVSESSEEKVKKRFNVVVRWFDKPVSLYNEEYAIKAIRFIDTEETVNKLLSGDDEKYKEALLDYWLKYDPDPFTTFNPLMLEYYHRVDYAIKSFSTITGRNGLETDRGKIYVQFGKPAKTERTSDDYGKVIETWTYDKPQKTFVFIDKRGTGNFSLND